MNGCKAGLYTTNEVITRKGLMCWGGCGFGYPECPHLDGCIEELKSQGYKFRKKKK